MKKNSKGNHYDHLKIEKKWQKFWVDKKVYKTEDPSTNSGQEKKKPKSYVLDMFPYPSGDGLHVGHPKGYIATDIYSRFKRMNGFNVLHPMGWDAFGLPAENYAIKMKVNPAIMTARNIKRYKEQMGMIGFDYDWSREINTTDPKYYKWTQWIFLQLLKKGLAYQSYEPINWCPSCQTGLANEDLEDGKCERCGSEVEKKPMRQWVLKITDYADRLLKDLDGLNWPESIKESQRNWIGRSVGSEISFDLNKKYKYVILHGWKSDHTRCWFPWLTKELEARGHEVVVLDMPHTFIPDVVEQAKFILDRVTFDADTIIIGHSLGSVVSLRILEQLKTPIKKLLLVAGLMEPKFKDKERFMAKYLMSWKFDFEKIKKNVGEIVILEDRKDMLIPAGEADVLQAHLGGKVFKFDAEKSHVCGNVEPVVLDHCTDKIKVFTTRADTLFGATYLVLAPEHEIISKLKAQNSKLIQNWKEIENYITKTSKRSEIERTAEEKEKTGVELKGIKAINPMTGKEIPIWIADYVLPDYGTGAIMAVPAHDTRDLAFARKYNLPIIQVVAKENELTRSYLMGAPAITDADLISLGIQIAEKKADGDRKLLIPKKSLPLYEELISEEISKGFWNEYVGEEIVFIFKDKKGKVSRFALSPDNEEQIDKLAAEYVGEKWNKKGVWNWLAENEWYQDLILHHDKGHLVNSGIFSKLPSDKAAVAITKAIRGKLTTKYKLRDWVFSRQRYWGEPIPVIHCPVCATVVPVPEKDLPVLLPKVKSYAPTGTGESPLADIAKWVNVKCPVCGSKAKRETNTMPQWAGSSWYYLRYIDPDNNKKLADTKKLDYWLGTGLPRSESSSRDSATGVDLYVGGTEHTTRHLIYARFWHKFLQDIGVVNCSEPFKQLKNQGMILGADNRKMSKRWGNVVNPDDVVKNYGADTLRVYEMFMGPFEQGASWNTNNMIGSRRFVERVWRLSEKVIARPGLAGKINPDLEILFNKTIKKVGEDIENFSFNTAISALMILTNALEKEEKISPEYWQDLLLIFAPFAPHVAEELWQKSGHQKSIISEKWPSFDSQKLVSEKIKIVIQVNGKVRGEVEISGEMGEAEIVKIANGTESIKKWLNNEKVKKTIYIKGKLLNFVI